jgi:beta-galactosidase
MTMSFSWTVEPGSGTLRCVSDVGAVSEPGSSRPLTRGVPTHGRGLLFGGDYNPEQWSEDVWEQDLVLMARAGVTFVTVGVFSWARLEPAEGEYDLAWLDRVLDGLHGAGIGVDLATPSAGPPPWLNHTYPETLPMTAGGVRLGYGARESFCPSSPDYRRAAVRMADVLGARYSSHPAVLMWHVGNEFGAHVGACHCPTSARAFRRWLAERYGDIEKLNDVWGTAFWSQHYRDFDEITTPVRAPMPVNPAQQLDFARFTSDEYRTCYELERDVLRSHDTVRSITTNLMLSNCKNLDYWSWADSVDFVANDHYLVAESPDRHIDLALAADLSRSLHAGRPWLLMEHSTSAVNWQPRNVAKLPGEMRRNALAHIARGSEGALFFQWRASRRGAEQFHSAMLPHGGTGTRVWREVCELGADLALLGPVRGSRVTAEVAVWWDWQSWWATELEFRPAQDLNYLERVHSTYRALWEQGHTVDIVGPGSDLSGYRALLVPSAFLLSEASSEVLGAWVRDGGHLLVEFFSAVVDESEAVHPEGFLGPLRELLGAWVEEYHPLSRGQSVHLDDGSSADLWSESVIPTTARVLARFADGPDRGGAAVTCNDAGRGRAWYLATQIDRAARSRLVRTFLDKAGITLPHDLPMGVEVVRRHGSAGDFVFVINHTAKPVIVEQPGRDLLTGLTADRASVAPGEVAVIATDPSDAGGGAGR